MTSLLLECDREFAVADARDETFDEFCHGVFAVGADQLSESGEQAGLCEAIAIDAVVPCFGPGLVEIAERGPLLLVIGQRLAGSCKGHWMAHEAQQAWLRDPGRSASNRRGLARAAGPPRPVL